MSFDAFFDGPNNYRNKFDFYEQGASPLLLEKLIGTIEKQRHEILEVNISWYLYNNNILHDYLKDLSKSGISINVITIPLEGYDNSRPRTLEDLATGKRRQNKVTKYELAREIFAEMYRSEEYPNFNIYFFSHLYVRSEYLNKFSRGSLPYSLHIKSAYIKKKTGYIALVSSSNLSVRDLVKHESMICIQDEAGYEMEFKSFYADLIRNSINIKVYEKRFDTTCNSFEPIDFKNTDLTFISAPFYKDSANDLDSLLCGYILNAKERIVICAQHLAAFNYEFNARYHSTIKENKTRLGVLGAVLDMAKKGLKTTCLSQTFAPPPSEEKRFAGTKFRRPANSANFQQFYSQLILTDNTEYFVNENLHSKYIIIDDMLIYCTYNFTPTQFIYLDRVSIPNFRKMPELSYEGIHCEVGMHVVIRERHIVRSFEKNVEAIKTLSGTIRVK